MNNPPASKASREVANLTEKKIHIRLYGVKELKGPYFSGRAWELKMVILQNSDTKYISYLCKHSLIISKVRSKVLVERKSVPL